jgi:hypothetical protein
MGISPSQGKHKQNTSTQTSMLRVWFEPTTPAFEQVRSVHASEPVITVICILSLYLVNFNTVGICVSHN